MQQDHVDRVLDLWGELEPTVDTFPLRAGARLLRAARRLEALIEEALKPLGLSFFDFDVINTVRREGGAEGVTPKQLAGFALITSGAMTARLDRLERTGLITRHPDPYDRRAIRVMLTERGEELARAGFRAVIEADREFLAPLSREEQDEMGRCLRLLLLEYDLPQMRTLSSMTPRRMIASRAVE